jgi:hypothetical protein
VDFDVMSCFSVLFGTTARRAKLHYRSGETQGSTTGFNGDAVKKDVRTAGAPCTPRNSAFPRLLFSAVACCKLAANISTLQL